MTAFRSTWGSMTSAALRSEQARTRQHRGEAQGPRVLCVGSGDRASDAGVLLTAQDHSSYSPSITRKSLAASNKGLWIQGVLGKDGWEIFPRDPGGGRQNHSHG